jgi:membrane protein implicated in regulation of membrane protease activity
MAMSPQMKWGIAGVIIALVLFGFIPWYIPAVLLVIAIAVAGTGWRALSPSQRRRIREIRRRRELGR